MTHTHTEVIRSPADVDAVVRELVCNAADDGFVPIFSISEISFSNRYDFHLWVRMTLNGVRGSAGSYCELLVECQL